MAMANTHVESTTPKPTPAGGSDLKITVTGLLGQSDVEATYAEGEPLVIIHGQNGTGKTKFLKAVHALMQAELWDLIRIPFTTLQIQQGSTILRADNDASSPSHILRIHTADNSGESQDYEFERRALDLRAGSGPFISSGNAKPLDTYDVLLESEADPNFPIPAEDWHNIQRIRKFCSAFNSHLVTTDRLLPQAVRLDSTEDIWRAADALKRLAQSGVPAARSTLDIISDDIKDQITQTLSNSAKESQTRHAGSMERLFADMVAVYKQDPVELIAQMRSLHARNSDKYKRLAKFGLMVLGAPDPDQPDHIVVGLDQMYEKKHNLDDNDRRMLQAFHIHLRDVQRELAAFDDLLAKLELLHDVLSSRFLHKRLNIHATHGITIHPVDQPDRRIELNELSSGEQHALVLFYNLLFRTADKSLILIDEPEISLHVEWQRSFLDECLQLVQGSESKLLIATHSPQIVASHTDKLVYIDPQADQVR